MKGGGFVLCYRLNEVALKKYMDYHGIASFEALAKALQLSPTYLSLIRKGRRPLNEALRLRIQLLTRLRQDELFLPDLEAPVFNQQSFAYMKHMGIIPYSKYSVQFNALEERIEADLLQHMPDGRARFFKKTKYKRNNNATSP